MNNKFYLGSLLMLLGCVLASATEVSVAASGLPTEYDAIRMVIFLPLFISGALFAFFGLKLIKVIIFLSGFIPATGFSFTGFAAANLFSSGGSNPSGSIFGAAILALIVGTIVGFITLFCMKVAIFFAGFFAGFGAVMICFILLMGQTGVNAAPLGMIVGFFGGIAALWIWEKAVIVITSFIGASQIAGGIICMTETSSSFGNSRNLFMYFLAFLAVFILGVLFQNKTKPAKPANGIVFMPHAVNRGNVVINVNQNYSNNQSVNNVNNSVNNYNNVVNHNNLPTHNHTHNHHQAPIIQHANPYGNTAPAYGHPAPSYGQAAPSYGQAPQQFIPAQQPQYQAPPMYQQPEANHFAPQGGNFAPPAY